MEHTKEELLIIVKTFHVVTNKACTCKSSQSFEQQQEENLQSPQKWQPEEDDLRIEEC